MVMGRFIYLARGSWLWKTAYRWCSTKTNDVWELRVKEGFKMLLVGDREDVDMCPQTNELSPI